MKFLFFSICLILGNQLLAQSDLDKKITEFAEQHNLYGKKLDKLQAISTNSKLSEDDRNSKWEKAFAKWDKNNVTKAFNAEETLVNYLTDSYYNYRRKIPGYTIEFLMFRTYELESVSRLSDQNADLLRQLLNKQVTIKPEFADDVAEIETAVQQLFSNSTKGLENLGQLSDFLTINDPNLAGKDLETKIKAIGKYNEKDLNAFSKYLTEMGIHQSNYALITGLTGPPLYREIELSTVLGSSFFDVADNRDAPSIFGWNRSDYLKYSMFIENEEIKNYMIVNFLTQYYLKAQKMKVNLSEIGQQSYKKRQVPGNDALLGFEYIFSRFKKRLIPIESNETNIQKLLIAAYNDVYFNFEKVSNVLKKGSLVNFDWNKLNLSFDQRLTIDAILSEDEEITQEGLKLGLSNGLFENIEWDLEFKLACYYALYNKAINHTREWNASEYVLNPFGKEEDQITKSFAVLDSTTLNQIKDDCRKNLEATAYSNMTFRISFDGDKVVTVHPYIYEERILAGIVKRALAEHPNLGNLSFLVKTNEVKINSDANRETWYLEPTPPPPPVPQTKKSLSTKNSVEAEIIDFPDVDAEFPGGVKALLPWIKENLVYPELSVELGDQGRVYVEFVVETDGSITGVKVMRGGVSDELNREARRLVRTMPKWTPAMVKGKPVRVRCRVPITFSLD